MFSSAEDTDEVEAEAEAGDPAGMVRDHGLGPHQGHYHALLNALADALPRTRGLPGEKQMHAYMFVQNGGFAFLTYTSVLQAKKQDKALNYEGKQMKRKLLLLKPKDYMFASFPIFLYICYVCYLLFLLSILNKVRLRHCVIL